MSEYTFAPLRTARQIKDALRRGVIDAEHAQALLNGWDEERVDAEVAELLAHREEPDREASFPALLWERYWRARANAVLDPLLQHYQYICDDPKPGVGVPNGVIYPHMCETVLNSHGVRGCRVRRDYRQGIVVELPPLPPHAIGVILTKVSL